MIQAIIIILGFAILGTIFLRRYMMTEKGVSSFMLLGKKKNAVNLAPLEPVAMEVTVEEMIPETSTVDAKNAAKADMMVKRADAVLAKGGDLKQAEQLLIQGIALDPSNTDAYHKLGLMYLHQGQFGKAENLYHKLVLSVQTDPVYFSNLALALYQQKKLEDAKKHYKKAIELDASRPARIFSLAQVLQELGEVQDAIAHFRTAIEMDPKNVDYLLTLAQVYVEAGMPSDAQLILQEVIVTNPNNEIAQEMLKSLPKKESESSGSTDAQPTAKE